jgi:hypothetical protein
VLLLLLLDTRVGAEQMAISLAEQKERMVRRILCGNHQSKGMGGSSWALLLAAKSRVAGPVLQVSASYSSSTMKRPPFPLKLKYAKPIRWVSRRARGTVKLGQWRKVYDESEEVGEGDVSSCLRLHTLSFLSWTRPGRVIAPLAVQGCPGLFVIKCKT